MTVKDFFRKVDGSRSLCTKLYQHQVEVRLKSKDGLTISDHFTLTEVSYMFSPLFVNEDGTRGSLVLEFQVD